MSKKYRDEKIWLRRLLNQEELMKNHHKNALEKRETNIKVLKEVIKNLN